VADLLPTLALIFAAVTALFWAGTLFFQAYIYSEPVADLYWRAPLAAFALSLFLGFWCMLAYRNPGRYSGSFLEFSASEVEQYDKFVSVKNGKETVYTARRNSQGNLEYRSPNGRPWNRSDADGIVEAIIVEEKDGTKSRFEAELTPDRKFKAGPGQEERYVEVGGRGRVMTDQYIGRVYTERRGREFAYILLNLAHLADWFLCLWLLLRFQWSHALGLAVVLWLVMMLAVFPLLAARTKAAVQEKPASREPAAALLQSSRGRL
jgi:hypothetical protein